MNLFQHHSDQQLLSLLKEDNERAFIELYNRYANKVRTLAYSKLNSTEATQEIVQEIFSTIWERRRVLEINSLWNYLAIAVKYQAINHIKSEIAFKKHSTFYSSFLKVTDEEVLKQVQFNNLEEVLEESVQKLPEKTQLVFRLNRLEGKTISEIAVKLNLSEKAIKYHISKSLKELRFYLKEFLVSVVYFIFYH